MAKEKTPKGETKFVSPTLTKNISITLPIHLINRLNNLEMSGSGINVSKTIRYILEDYIGVDGNGKVFQNLSKEDVYVPVDLYVDLMQIGKLTLKNRATKGEIRIVSSFGNDYVQMDKDNAMNFYAQLKMYREEVKEMKKRMDEVEEAYSQMGELIKIVNQLKDKKAKIEE